MVLWGGWLLVTGLVFSLAQGIIHPYYTVALAPAIGAIVGIGTWFLWSRRRRSLGPPGHGLGRRRDARCGRAVLLDRVPTWHPWLRTAITRDGCIAAALLVVSPYYERVLSARAARPVVVGLAGLAGIAVLAGPFAYTLATVATPHSGAIPSAGPASAALAGFPGGAAGLGAGGSGRGRSGARPGGGPAASAPEAGAALARRRGAGTLATGNTVHGQHWQGSRRGRFSPGRFARRRRPGGTGGAGFSPGATNSRAGPAVASAGCSTRARPAPPLRPPSRRTRPGTPGWRPRSVPTRLPVTSWRPGNP